MKLTTLFFNSQTLTVKSWKALEKATRSIPGTVHSFNLRQVVVHVGETEGVVYILGDGPVGEWAQGSPWEESKVETREFMRGVRAPILARTLKFIQTFPHHPKTPLLMELLEEEVTAWNNTPRE